MVCELLAHHFVIDVCKGFYVTKTFLADGFFETGPVTTASLDGAKEALNDLKECVMRRKVKFCTIHMHF